MYDHQHQGNLHHSFQQQQQRGGSLERGHASTEEENNPLRLRRPMPLPLSARHGQPSFLRPRWNNFVILKRIISHLFVDF